MLYIFHFSYDTKIILKLHFWHKRSRFCPFYATMLWMLFHNVSKIYNSLGVIIIQLFTSMKAEVNISI